jgi:hypothetical protein
MPSLLSKPAFYIDLNYSDDGEDSLRLLPVSHMADRLNWLTDVDVDDEG